MTDQDILDFGFYEFKPSPLESDGVEKCFQKRYDDTNGKKYFITIKKWKALKHPSTHEIIPESYEYNIQLYKKYDHNAIDLIFHSSWILKDVEEYLEQLWRTGLFDYYETWTDNNGIAYDDMQ